MNADSLPANGHVLISMNPTSGATDRRPLVESLRDSLAARGLQVEILTDIDVVVSRVAEISRAADTGQGPGLRAVVGAGGDGTISLLANRLPPGTPLAVLPLGTENLLAKYLGLTANPRRLAEIIAAGHTRWLDAGRANGQLFLVMASCGFDAAVVQRMHAQRSGHIRHWSYAVPVLGAIRRYRYPTIRLVLEDGSTLESKWAFIFNVPRYAMNLRIAAEADPEDGKLDVCTFRGGSFWRGLYYLLTILLGKHRQWTSSRLHRTSRLRLEADDPVPYQLDGDPGGELPLEIEVLPRFLQLLVGETGDRDA